MTKEPLVSVLGSINMDFVVETPRLPLRGETVLGRKVAHYPGGKGANQAVAAARLGAHVSLFGMVGDDSVGEDLLQAIRTRGVGVDRVERKSDVLSGMASIWVAEDGENSIVCVPGANSCVDAAYVDGVLPHMRMSSVVLFQLEIPVVMVAHAIERLPHESPLLILDPAPAQDISTLPLERIDIITPNRGELATLTGIADLERATVALLDRGVKVVVCKCGADGAFVVDNAGLRHFPGFRVSTVDATAAGDAFNGALAVALAESRPFDEALMWANAAGAIAVTRRGAQCSLPSREEVLALIRSQGGF
ncbi:MAG: ribokinase [Candidatus Bipolaricaulota bacterium]